jgi:site-specific recombinase XerD
MSDFVTTHAVVHLSIDAADAQTLPVVVELDDPKNPEISISAAKFARYQQLEGARSYETISKTVVAIGKLRDYYKLVCKDMEIGPGKLRTFLEEFLAAFDRGTVLGWRPASNQQYQFTRSAIFDYVKFLMDTSLPFWSAGEAQFLDACRESWISLSHADKSLLFHTKPRSRKKTASGRKRQTAGLTQFKPFPPHLVQELIGGTKNPRDKLLFGILAYGGKRLSELMHLFMLDIRARGDELMVELKHPSYASMTWTNQAHQRVTGQRREYLKSMHDLLPRTEHGANRSAAGWKGMKFDDQAALSSEVYWIGKAGQYLLHLHRQYLHGARASVPKRNHPFYFVAEDGEPMTIKAVERQFQLACRRLEKKHGISLKGYGPHSLRHFYGFYCADVLQADLLLIQKWMGHVQIGSTAAYAHISPGSASRALKRAEKQAQIEGRTYLSIEERKRVAEEFAEAKLEPLPHNINLGSIAFGQIDTRALTRRMQ